MEIGLGFFGPERSLSVSWGTADTAAEVRGEVVQAEVGRRTAACDLAGLRIADRRADGEIDDRQLRTTAWRNCRG